MAQWQEVQNLANTHLEQVHQLYAGSALPMAVRQCLAAWIESQNWRQAAEPLSSHAPMLFHSLLVLLGERLGSLGSGYEDFMLKHNLRKAHRDLQAEFGKKPEQFANLVANLLQEERRILRLGQAGGQAGSAPAPSPAPESGREQQIQRRLAEFQTALQEADRAFRHLEELQDAFDFCYKVHYLPGHERSRDPEYIQELQALQAKLQKLDRRRREVLAQMQQLLGRSETLQELLQQELGDWRVRQQRLCLGGPGDANLRPLETWFTELGQGLFQLRQLLRALGDLRQKVTYERDPLAAETPLLEQRLQEQLTHLLRSAFVVEQQPSTPNARQRPLVLRTGSKFSARARLLLRLHDRNHRMEAKIHIDRDPPNVKGFRRFNILTSSSKTLLAGDSPQEGLICDFQYLVGTPPRPPETPRDPRGRVSAPPRADSRSPQTLKEQKDSRAGKGKGGGGEGPLVVTEELHLITFTLAYAYCGLELELETTTLPFVIISNNNQLSSAWASILWFNMLSSDPKASGEPRCHPRCHPLPRPAVLLVASAGAVAPLAEVLSWQFQSVAERGLSRENLLMLAKKLLGSKPSPDSTVAWPKFSKDGAAGFSFWTWLDAILGLLQEHLKQLWKDGLILGFVSRKQEEKLLRSKRTGTFLLRFSESVLGGVTFTWVEHHETELSQNLCYSMFSLMKRTETPLLPRRGALQSLELVSLALPDIIRNYQMMMEENPPENPLKFLYPGTARDEAFGRYYSQKQEENLGESKKYLNRRLIRVSSRQPAWKTEEELVFATENLETLQLQPGGPGAQRAGGLALPQGLGTPQGTPGNVGTPQGTPGNVGTPQGTPGNVGTPQGTPGNVGTPQGVAVSPGTPQGMATSPGTLQVTPGNLGTSQVMATSPGTPQMVAASTGTLQVTPGNLGTSQVMAMTPGTLQVTPGNLGTPQVMVTSPGTLQVTPGNLGTPQVMAMGPGTLQVTRGNLGTSQVMATSPGTPQMVAASPGTLQVTPGNLGTPQMMAASPGTLQVTPGNLGTSQVMATSPGTLQVVATSQGYHRSPLGI
ncbi:hypothetical protein DUI87_33271 [Hirundo rustica rustica]|uniref:Signal transducer and activator of transcription n=1 Tax=Hirundo rustica rustica TaxID=333673 RepID=A0A3M0IP11_HIRRU|nr:hypothetical protein DUI87_33271 [Hirundo rustica rustica]